MRLLPALLGLAVACAACTLPSDVGQPCVLLDPEGGVVDTKSSTADDFLVSSEYAACPIDGICLHPAGPGDAGSGICTATCAPDNANVACGPSADCDSSHTGLVCRSLTLDPKFIQEVEANDGGKALIDQLGLSSMYCGPPPDGGC